MAINPAELESPKVYDYDLIGRMAGPNMGAKMIRKDIVHHLERMGLVSNPQDESDAEVAVAEITKDIVTHSEETELRVVILQPAMGFAALHSLSFEKTDKKVEEDEVSDAYLDQFLHNGEKLLKGMYGQDYWSERRDSGEFERHLVIRGDVDVEFPSIHHEN